MGEGVGGIDLHCTVLGWDDDGVAVREEEEEEGEVRWGGQETCGPCFSSLLGFG